MSGMRMHEHARAKKKSYRSCANSGSSLRRFVTFRGSGLTIFCRGKYCWSPQKLTSLEQNREIYIMQRTEALRNDQGETIKGKKTQQFDACRKYVPWSLAVHTYGTADTRVVSAISHYSRVLAKHDCVWVLLCYLLHTNNKKISDMPRISGVNTHIIKNIRTLAKRRGSATPRKWRTVPMCRSD